jgi:hypothetical protein
MSRSIAVSLQSGGEMMLMAQLAVDDASLVGEVLFSDVHLVQRAAPVRAVKTTHPLFGCFYSDLRLMCRPRSGLHYE